jgi:hypothetical protein
MFQDPSVELHAFGRLAPFGAVRPVAAPGVPRLQAARGAAVSPRLTDRHLASGLRTNRKRHRRPASWARRPRASWTTPLVLAAESGIEVPRRVASPTRAGRGVSSLGWPCGQQSRPKKRYYADARPARRGNGLFRQTGSTAGSVLLVRGGGRSGPPAVYTLDCSGDARCAPLFGRANHLRQGAVPGVRRSGLRRDGH